MENIDKKAELLFFRNIKPRYTEEFTDNEEHRTDILAILEKHGNMMFAWNMSTNFYCQYVDKTLLDSGRLSIIVEKNGIEIHNNSFNTIGLVSNFMWHIRKYTKIKFDSYENNGVWDLGTRPAKEYVFNDYGSGADIWKSIRYDLGLVRNKKQ